VLLKGLAKKPDDRFPTARAFAEALLACSSARSWTSRDASDWWHDYQSSGTVDSPGPSTANVHQEQTLVMADGLSQ
jgi:hypothetical protein